MPFRSSQLRVLIADKVKGTFDRDEVDHIVVFGGSGNDKLYGGSGRDLLIGGEGSDELRGEKGDDILIGGSTAFDEDPDSLQALLDDFRSSRSFSDRVDDLSTGSGDSGLALDDSSLLDDDAADQLFGGGNSDWFLAFERDRVRDRNNRSDRVNQSEPRRDFSGGHAGMRAPPGTANISDACARFRGPLACLHSAGPLLY